MAVLANIGVMGQGNEILMPMLKNRFMIDFIGLNEQNLKLQVIQADRPKLSFEEVVLDRYNSRAYIAGKHTFETINVTFESDIGSSVLRAIQRQIEHQQRLVGLGSVPTMSANRAAERYKFTTVLSQLSGEGTGEIFEQWFMEGCWIQNMDWGDLDYAASETVKLVMTLRFDHAYENAEFNIRGKATPAGDAPRALPA